MGKSAIAQTFIECCVSKGRLLGSFAFSAQDPARNHIGAVVATIAFQLSVLQPSTRNHIALAVLQNQLIFDETLDEQFDKLVSHPLQATRYDPSAEPFVIVVDGIDQCLNSDEQTRFVTSLHHFIGDSSAKGIPIHVLLTSRSTPHLVNACLGIGAHSLHTISLEECLATEDIRRFLNAEFRRIHATHPMHSQLGANWPAEYEVDCLVQRANSRF
jgi:hypothetical protein